MSGQSIPQPVMGPVRPKERIEVIDILRGFALFGVLLVNSSHDVSWDFLLEEQWPGILDRAGLERVERIYRRNRSWLFLNWLTGTEIVVGYKPT